MIHIGVDATRGHREGYGNKKSPIVSSNKDEKKRKRDTSPVENVANDG